MKETCLVVLAFFVWLTAGAQDYRKFKFGMGLGYAAASQSNGGIAMYFEPMFRITDNIAVGTKFEYAGLATAKSTESSVNIGSLSINGQYYLSNKKFRPFIGAGLGFYSMAPMDLLLGFSLESVTAFGFYPRIGFDLGHFNFTLDYNIISQKAPATITLIGIPIGTVAERDANYLGIKIGFSLGGGTN